MTKDKANVDSLKKLKAQRSSLKGRMTRMKTYFDSVNQVDPIDIRSRLSQLETLFKEYNDVQLEIEVLEDAEQDELDRSLVEENYFALITQANHLLTNTNSSSNSIEKVNTDSQLNNGVKLPTIKLPTFSGLYEEWLPFYDTFNSIIHANNTIPEIQKSHYLKSSLQGEAAEIIHSLTISNENYQIAWDMLKNRFDNKRIIIQQHVKSIFELPSSLKENHIILRQILDGLLKHTRALHSLGRPTDTWDDLLLYLITGKLDITTNKQWEENQPTPSTIPTLKDLTDFLSKRCQILESMTRKTQTISTSINQNKSSKSITHVTTNGACPICGNTHQIYQCNNFLNLTPDQRFKEVKSKKLCINCLRSNHQFNQCKAGSCKHCNKKHNSLLHTQRSHNEQQSWAETISPTVNNHCTSYQTPSQILLSTALIYVLDKTGKQHSCRVLLDSGSQSNFITRSLAETLKLHQESFNVPVIGVNQSKTFIKNSVNVKLRSMHNKFETIIQCLVVDKITEKLPLLSIKRDQISIPKNIRLADPSFNISGLIDMLIGADLFWKLLCVGRIKLAEQQPYFQKSHLGWIVSGRIAINQETNKTFCNFSMETLNANVARFWQLEEIPHTVKFTPNEQKCENYFSETIRRNEEGRHIVKLPKNEKCLQLGESSPQAFKRFYSLEKRLKKQPEIKEEYTRFLAEYLELGHMSPVTESKEPSSTLPTRYFLPHHCVQKTNSSTTKLRVVFDGSAKTSTGISLNDALMVGPTIQQDLFSILTRFRTHQIVFIVDIEKMYRQILVDETDRKLQCILWRPNPTDKITTYQLNTITYGTACASFLAIRCLHQLAADEAEQFPKGSQMLLNDFYVDDLLTGANTLKEAKQIQSEIKTLLQRGGFHLRKWASNVPTLVREDDISANQTIQDLNKTNYTYTLGLQWNPIEDKFQFNVPGIHSTNATKRSILSFVAQIFDPLGLVGPIITHAKILIQKIWKLQLDWDESLPMDLHSEWVRYQREIINLTTLSVPRKIISSITYRALEIHGFADASQEAYGACVYVRIIKSDGKGESHLLCSKSRVAPIKYISIPKLELSAALLLAQLMDKLLKTINLQSYAVHYWTDSIITLAWIKSKERRWKIFVANQVSQIHELTETIQWHHVSSTDNPADIISRGSTPETLQSSSLWWQGPSWLEGNIDKN